MQVTKCCVLLILSIVFHYYKKETSWRLSLFSGAPPLPAAKGRLPAGGLIEILQGELAGVSPTGTPSLRNRNILPKIDFDRLFHVGASYILLAPTFSKVRARSLRCSSFPNRTRCAGLRFGFGCNLERKSILPTYCKKPLRAARF